MKSCICFCFSLNYGACALALCAAIARGPLRVCEASPSASAWFHDRTAWVSPALATLFRIQYRIHFSTVAGHCSLGVCASL